MFKNEKSSRGCLLITFIVWLPFRGLRCGFPAVVMRAKAEEHARATSTRSSKVDFILKDFWFLRVHMEGVTPRVGSCQAASTPRTQGVLPLAWEGLHGHVFDSACLDVLPGPPYKPVSQALQL